MKKADLYIRVSTDEQADKGYSQRDQEERLKRYCENNNIKVDQIIYEDYSAKTFIRPEWIKLLDTLKKKAQKRIYCFLQNGIASAGTLAMRIK
jgi:DNA invertase Pin-like site-specific DNA recombinase